MAHFASVNEDALISSINQCINNLNSVNNGDLVNLANSMQALGYKTKASIVSAASTINGSFSALQSSLNSCLSLANKIKAYKSQKKIVDELEKQEKKLESELKTLKSNKNAAYNMYHQYKNNPERQAEASSYHSRYIKLSKQYEEKKEEYQKIYKEYKKEKEELKKQASSLTAMGFSPESN